MNKLRKPTSPSGTFGRSTSRTMQLAKDLSISLKSTTSRANDGRVQQHGTTLRRTVISHEMGVTASQSKEIQYWTMRAHSAETQLQLALSASRSQNAQHVHVHGTASGNSSIQNVAVRQDGRIARLEWLVIILLVLIVILVLVVVYLYASYTSPQTAPAHFTIPILSPFTSVVEHETSVIGSKTIALILLITGLLSYLAIRLRFWS
ncbi:hypothetical protein E4T56_gene17814 [Termitomyces sp. T112]|nr:hypothetical protein E4T56_gene17814 [Termitomyces sp. T112]